MRAGNGTVPGRGSDVEDARTPHRWGGLAALSLCGAVAGASVAEVIASIFTQPTAAVVLQPAANPLALVGAVLGLGAVLVNRRRLGALLEPHVVSRNEADESDELAAALPLHPQSWVPVPTGPLAMRTARASQGEEIIALEPHPFDEMVTVRPPRHATASAPLRLIPTAPYTSAQAQCPTPRIARRAPHPGTARQRQTAAQ